MKINVVIVDDEQLARERLARLLGGFKDLEILQQCSHGTEAVEVIQALKPDLVFLDVQMPELDGFGVLAALPTENRPVIIFTTAHDQFAVKAFEVHAIDYLLKPFDRDRLEQAVTRARTILQKKEPSEMQPQLGDLLKEVRPKPAIADRISVKSEGRIVLLRTEQIDWIEAADNYISLYVGKSSHLLRETMNSIEARLDTSKFLRISRSIIVNSERVKELHPLFHGEFTLVLHDGTKLNSSRNYRDKLKERFGV